MSYTHLIPFLSVRTSRLLPAFTRRFRLGGSFHTQSTLPTPNKTAVPTARRTVLAPHQQRSKNAAMAPCLNNAARTAVGGQHGGPSEDHNHHPNQGTDHLIHTPSTAFRHLPPNSARIGYATEGAVFISAQLSTDAVSALRKVWVLLKLQALVYDTLPSTKVPESDARSVSTNKTGNNLAPKHPKKTTRDASAPSLKRSSVSIQTYFDFICAGVSNVVSHKKLKKRLI